MLWSERCAFSYNIAKLILWANDTKGWKLALDEGRVIQGRKGLLQANGVLSATISYFSDRIHLPNSFHYQGLAQDLVLYVNGVPIEGDDSEWDEIGAYWKTLDPNCTWGKDFGKGDIDHFSWGEK